MEERLSCFIWSETMSDRLGDRLLWTPCQALAERILNEPDKDLIATFQPEQHAHEIKLNLISAPSQIKHTVKGSVWKYSIKKMPCCYSSTAYSNFIFQTSFSSKKLKEDERGFLWAEGTHIWPCRASQAQAAGTRTQIMGKAECHGRREQLRLHTAPTEDCSIQHILTACDLPRQKSKDQAKVSKYGIYYEPCC